LDPHGSFCRLDKNQHVEDGERFTGSLTGGRSYG
jgi:hypothetical protein